METRTPSTNKFAKGARKISRRLHRDLSFFFSGVILVYAVSGIALNHKSTFNSNYDINRYAVSVTEPIPDKSAIDQAWVKRVLLEPFGEEQAYTKHYYPQPGTIKVFLKGGSSVVVDLGSGKGEYESIKKRPILSALNRLHYNPGKWWTTFSDIFAVGLIVITITGWIMMRGKKGLWGWGGVELLAGIAVPLVFLFFF